MVDGRIVAICQYGGEFISSPDGTMTYTGGDAHIVDISVDMMFDDFKTELTGLYNIDMSDKIIKYFLANNKRTLITVSTDKDLRRMVEFNINSVTTEVFILNKPENRNKDADSGPSDAAAAAAAAAAAKRKRIASSKKAAKPRTQEPELFTPNAGALTTAYNFDSVKHKRPSAIVNVDNRNTEIVADEDRENGNMPVYPSTPLFATLESPDDGRQLGTVTLWDDLITGVGQEFDNAGEMRALLCKYAISKGFVYKFIKNESTRVTAKCVEEDCPWRLYAAASSRKQKFVIKKFNNVHTCGGSNKDGQKRATRHWLTSIMIEKLHSTPHTKPKEIVREIYEDYGVTLTYSQVWRTREIAQRELYNMLKETYSQLPWFCERILETNPGSVAMLSTSHDSRFRRFFVAFHASLHGFEHGCRPLLFLDRIPLKSNNQCKLLAAAAVDGDDAVFPVAFAVVEDETFESWLWFLAQLKYAITTSRAITFVSNRQKGLDQAVPQVFEDSYHSFCLRHLVEDLKLELKKGPWTQQAKEGMIDDFTRAAQACTIEDFNTYIDSIRNVSPEIAEWVLASKPQNWSDALFRGSRYDHFASNIMDSMINWIPVKSETSIVLMVDAIRSKLTDVMLARRETSNAWTGTLTPSMEAKLEKEMTKARKLHVLCSSESLFEVRGTTIYVVNIGTWECTCCRWQVSGLPCQHAIAAFNRVNKSVYDHCSRYFRTECYRLTYSASIQPIPDLASLDFNSGASLYPPPVRRTPARPRRKRFNPNRPVKLVRICSRCKVSGHNKATCDALL